MAAIFLSYRRTDAGGYAGRIFDRLCTEFGANAVFRDVDGIRSGSLFSVALNQQLQDCRVFIPVIGPTWISATHGGGRRLDDENDWVRLEIATALQRKALMIPVTVGGATMPPTASLPEDLQPLTQMQARDLRDGDTWQSDLDLLIDRIRAELGGISRRRKRLILAAFATIALLTVGIWGFVRWNEESTAPPTVVAPSSEPIVIFETGNKEDVTQSIDGPPEPAVFKIQQPFFITHIHTYHWNKGQGSMPGRVSLRSQSGETFGPWEVAAYSGHNNAPNVNWFAQPRVVLPPGTYTVIDHEPATWSFNESSINRGFAIIKGQAMR